MDATTYEVLKAERDTLLAALRAMVDLGEWDKGRAHVSVAYVKRQTAAFDLARSVLADIDRGDPWVAPVSVCRGACNGKAPSPGCGHASHSPYGCLSRDEDGVPCDCSGDAAD